MPKRARQRTPFQRWVPSRACRGGGWRAPVIGGLLLAAVSACEPNIECETTFRLWVRNQFGKPLALNEFKAETPGLGVGARQSDCPSIATLNANGWCKGPAFFQPDPGCAVRYYSPIQFATGVAKIIGQPEQSATDDGHHPRKIDLHMALQNGKVIDTSFDMTFKGSFEIGEFSCTAQALQSDVTVVVDDTL